MRGLERRAPLPEQLDLESLLSCIAESQEEAGRGAAEQRLSSCFASVSDLSEQRSSALGGGAAAAPGRQRGGA